jgi:hypothetical protein
MFKGVLKSYSAVHINVGYVQNNLTRPVKLAFSEISQVHMQPQARCSILCIITPEGGPLYSVYNHT